MQTQLTNTRGAHTRSLWLLVLLFALTALTGCIKPYDHKFKVGDFVETVLDGRRGQVVSLYQNWEGVNVRFGVTKLHAPPLGGTVSQEPYAIVTMNEWELRPAK